MRELTVIEVNDVHGGAIAQFMAGEQNIAAAAVDTVAGAVYGFIGYSAFGGLQGGLTGNSKGGGMIGVGILTTGVGAIWGAIQGGIFGAIMGAYNGTASINTDVTLAIEGVFDGTGGGFRPS